MAATSFANLSDIIAVVDRNEEEYFNCDIYAFNTVTGELVSKDSIRQYLIMNYHLFGQVCFMTLGIRQITKNIGDEENYVNSMIELRPTEVFNQEIVYPRNDIILLTFVNYSKPNVLSSKFSHGAIKTHIEKMLKMSNIFTMVDPVYFDCEISDQEDEDDKENEDN